MAESNYWSTQGEQGTIKISEDVVASIAAVSAVETEGVSGLCAGLGADLAEFLGRKNLAKGVKVLFHGDLVSIDLNIIVQYDYVVREVAENAQKAIQSAIESMTGLQVENVDVHVQGISFLKDETKPMYEEEISADTAQA